MRSIIALSAFIVLGCSHLQPQFIKNIGENKAADIYERGNKYFEEKDYKNAVIEFEKIVGDYGATDAYEPSLYLLAFSHFKLNDYEAAVTYGEKFVKEFSRSTFHDNILALLGEANFKLAEDYKAVYYLTKYYIATKDTSSRRSALENLLKALPQLSISQLEKLHKLYISEPLDEHILYYLVRAEINAGKDEEAQRDFNLLTRRFPNSEYALQFGDYKRFATLGSTSGHAGVLLPITGKFSVYGLKLTQIIEIFVKNRYLPFTLSVRDTKSDPIEAILQAADLIDDEHVDFLIGPIFSIEAFGVCGIASGKGIPVVIPTALEPRFEALPSVFAMGQSGEKQAKMIARYATQQLDLVRIAVIYPANAKYEALGKIFASEVIKNDGQIVSMESFDPDSITLRWQLERTKKKDPEAIFLAMDTDQIINTAPQVAYYGMEKMKLLGMDSFNSERIPRLGEKYVENAVFIAPSTLDSTARSELKAHGLEESDPIVARFFQTLWKLKSLNEYSRINITDVFTSLLKGRETFSISQIRDGEFIRLTELSSDE